jgi:acyl carrier protein
VLVATRPLDVLIEEATRAGVRASAGHARRVPARVHLQPVADALQAHEAVAEAAAIGSPDDEDSPRVVAFVVYEPGRHATVSELRRFTRQQVERSFVPQNFVEMVALPRDEDGGVILAELRDPFAAVDDYIAPRSVTEKDIAAIWAELLGLDRVGIHDNFLDVGGHSLVGIRVLLRIQQATGVRLEANDLTLQTLEQLAAAVDRVAGPRGDAEAAVVTDEPTPDEPSPTPEPETGLFSRMKKAIAER